MASYRTSIKHIIGLLLLAILPLSVVGGLNYIVDPLQIYRKSKADNPSFWHNQRFQNAGKIRSYLAQDGYDSILLGNSIADCFTPKDIQKRMGWKKNLKLTVNGGHISEQSFMLKKALETGKIKHVFWGVRAENISVPTEDRWHDSFEIPFYLYTDTIFDDAPYLFNNNMFQNSLHILQGKKVGKRWMDQNDAISQVNYWMTPRLIKSYSSYRISNKYKRLEHHVETRSFPEINYNKKRSFPAIDKHIIHMVQSNPEIQFVFVLAPRHYLALKNLEKANERYMAAQKYLVMNLAGFANAMVFGFENLPIIAGNLANYRDVTHYHSGVNVYMLNKIVRNRQQLTPDNIDEYLSEILSHVQSYTPVFDYDAMIPMRSARERNIFRKERKRLLIATSEK